MKEATWLGRARLPVGDRLGMQRGRVPSSTGAGAGRSCGLALRASADWLVLDNIKRSIGLHRVRGAAHRRGADRARPDPVVPGARHRHARGLRPDRELRPRHRHPPDRIKLGTVGVAAPRHRGQALARGRDPAARARTSSWATYNKPEKTAETLRDGWLHTGDVGDIDDEGFVRDHRPHEGHHHHRGRQERHAVGDREPAQVLALHLRRGRDRRQAQVPLLPDHDRPRQRWPSSPRSENVPFTNFASLCRAPRGAGPDLERDRAGEPGASPGSRPSRSSG